jgi:hypothetical protein
MSEGFPSQDVERDHDMALASDELRTQAAEARQLMSADEQGEEIKVNYGDVYTQPNPVVTQNDELLYTEIHPDADEIVERIDRKAERIEAWAGILHDKPVDQKVAESWAPEREGGIDYSTAEGLLNAEYELEGLKHNANQKFDQIQKIYDRGADDRELNQVRNEYHPILDEIRGLEALVDTAQAGNMISKEQYQAIAYGTHAERREALVS